MFSCLLDSSSSTAQTCLLQGSRLGRRLDWDCLQFAPQGVWPFIHLLSMCWWWWQWWQQCFQGFQWQCEGIFFMFLIFFSDPLIHTATAIFCKQHLWSFMAFTQPHPKHGWDMWRAWLVPVHWHRECPGWSLVVAQEMHDIPLFIMHG